MLLNLLTACQQPSPADIPTPHEGGFYVKASQRLPPTESTVDLHRTKSNKSTKSTKRHAKRNSVTTVIIGMPTGFRHEFHLGRDVGSMEELWDLDRWRIEIENRVAEAAAQHAAMNAAAAEAELEEELRRRKPRPGSMVKRKPVPTIVPDADEPPVPPLPVPKISSELVEKAPVERVRETQTDATSTRSNSSLGVGSESEVTSDSEPLHSDQEHDVASDVSSLPPATPSDSRRASRDLSRASPQPVHATLVEIASGDDSRSNSQLNIELKPLPTMPVSQPGEFDDVFTAAIPPSTTPAPTVQSPHSQQHHL